MKFLKWVENIAREYKHPPKFNYFGGFYSATLLA
jgi:hypothetical protein